jgi:hypothetical protein
MAAVRANHRFSFRHHQESLVLTAWSILGRLDLLSSIAAEDAHEASHSMRLPARSLRDFGQRGALRTLHHGDHFGLSLARSDFGLAAGFLARPAFFAGFAFLGLRGPLVAGTSAAGVLVLSDSMLMLISP